MQLQELTEALKAAQAPLIYGLSGISMEEQRLAVALAKELHAAVAVDKVLLPTMTIAACTAHSLILTAGGDLPFAVPDGVRVIRDDRLLSADGFRALSALFRGRKRAALEEYGDLYEAMKEEKEAAFVLCADTFDERFFRAVRRFSREVYRLDVMQVTDAENALGAYAVMLEEAGCEEAFFGEEQINTGSACASDTLAFGGTDLLLRIGEAALLPEGDVPAYAIAKEARGNERLFKAVTSGGTALRYDGVSVSLKADPDREAPALPDCLKRLLEEVAS